MGQQTEFKPKIKTYFLQFNCGVFDLLSPWKKKLLSLKKVDLSQSWILMTIAA